MKLRSVKDEDLALLRIPPNRADIKITTPLYTSQLVNAQLKQMNLTSEDLKEIDWRDEVELSPVRQQANCGNCWAMSSTSALNDRFIIQKKMGGLVLDPLVPCQCVPEIRDGSGCNGGFPVACGTFFENFGTPREGDGQCPAWDEICTVKIGCGVGETKQPRLPLCNAVKQMCGGKPMYKAKKGSTSTLAVSGTNGKIDVTQTIINMKRELLKGPYVVSCFIPKDLLVSGQGYKYESTNGIYINGAYNDDLDKKYPNLKTALHIASPADWGDIMMEGGSPSAHAMELVGWKIGDAGPKYGKIPYWIIKNSWGNKWMKSGYFYYGMYDEKKGINTLLGLDIPVFDLTVLSDGKKIPLGGSPFGGATKFDPDLESGEEPDPKNDGRKRTVVGKALKSARKYVIGVIVVLIILGLLYGLYRWYYSKKQKGKKGQSSAKKKGKKKKK